VHIRHGAQQCRGCAVRSRAGCAKYLEEPRRQSLSRRRKLPSACTHTHAQTVARAPTWRAMAGASPPTCAAISPHTTIAPYPLTVHATGLRGYTLEACLASSPASSRRDLHDAALDTRATVAARQHSKRALRCRLCCTRTYMTRCRKPFRCEAKAGQRGYVADRLPARASGWHGSASRRPGRSSKCADCCFVLRQFPFQRCRHR